MLSKILPVALSCMMIAGSASAGQLTASPAKARSSALEFPGGEVREFSPVIERVQYYSCRRDCTWCRNDCYSAYRINCHGDGCREQFTLCMRGCWNNICRWC